MRSALRQLILTLHADHPDWSTRRVAAEAGTSKDSVRRVLAPPPAPTPSPAPVLAVVPRREPPLVLDRQTLIPRADGLVLCPRCREWVPVAVAVEHVLGVRSGVLRPIRDDEWTPPARSLWGIW